ncbi:hypothetical protein [Streptomyces sp. NPDC051662]
MPCPADLATDITTATDTDITTDTDINRGTYRDTDTLWGTRP